jgi:hypothetical protein
MLFNDIHKSLTKLTPKELESLQQRIQVLLDYAPADSKNQLGSEIYLALHKALEQRQIKCPSFNAFKKTRSYKLFFNQVKILQTFDDQLPTDMTKTTRIFFYAYAIQLLCDWLDTKDVVIRVHSVCGTLHLLPEILEKSFPGYLQSGLLVKVVNQLIKR